MRAADQPFILQKNEFQRWIKRKNFNVQATIIQRFWRRCKLTPLFTLSEKLSQRFAALKTVFNHAVEQSGRNRDYARAQTAIHSVFDGLDQEDRRDIDSGLYYFRQHADVLKLFGVELKPINQTLERF